MIINHIEVRNVRPNGAMKAYVRLGGVVVGTFRKSVTRNGRVQLYLPGGQLMQTEDGSWKIWEPLTVLYKGKFVNRELKAELYRLAGVWWKRHRLGVSDFSERDIARTAFADRHWTKPVELFVRPISYVPLEEARKADQGWNAGRAEVVIREGDFELIATIPIRRRAYGIEAALPLWTIDRIEEDYLGRRVDTKEYVPRFHFQAGGGYIDGQVLGAVTLIWAWHFKVTEPLVVRSGRCVGCRFLKFQPDERALTQKEDPVSRRWWCDFHGLYVDDLAARKNARLYMQGLERLAAHEAGLARFYAGCKDWVSRESRPDLKTLQIGDRYADAFLVDSGRLLPEFFALKGVEIQFTAPGYKNSEHPDTEVPATPVMIRPLPTQGAGRQQERRANDTPSPRQTSA